MDLAGNASAQYTEQILRSTVEALFQSAKSSSISRVDVDVNAFQRCLQHWSGNASLPNCVQKPWAELQASSGGWIFTIQTPSRGNLASPCMVWLSQDPSQHQILPLFHDWRGQSWMQAFHLCRPILSHRTGAANSAVGARPIKLNSCSSVPNLS